MFLCDGLDACFRDLGLDFQQGLSDRYRLAFLGKNLGHGPIHGRRKFEDTLGGLQGSNDVSTLDSLAWLDVDLHDDNLFIGRAGSNGIDEMESLFLFLGGDPGKVKIE